MKKSILNKGQDKMCSELFKLFGDRWSLRIIDALRREELRFKEIQAALIINSATLSSRLRSLEKAKLLVRKEETIDKLSVCYALTNLGKNLLPIYDGIIKFGKEVLR